MHQQSPTQAIILAAGLGTRMRPLTNDKPKALVEVHGRPLIDYILEKIISLGITHIVVNAHYCKDVLQEYLHSYARTNKGVTIHISEEHEILETGGGINQALSMLKPEPFFSINCDSLWQDGTLPLLQELSNHWDDTTMDALLVLYPHDKLPHFDGAGDFFLNPDKTLVRRGAQASAPFVYTGIQILHPRLFDNAPAGKFSLNILYDRALEHKKLFGMVHEGVWFHVSTPQDVLDTEKQLMP